MVLIGTCTGGSLKDFVRASEILKGRKACGNVEFLVVPSSREIYREAIKAGCIDTFLSCGATILPPSCGPCCGSSAGVPRDGANVLSTANRNFLGRMGNAKANIFLASPYTAAAAVLTGKITEPGVFLHE
jgi:3-isopropylmalate/(R)-2-methylmalate dehydratase large subunit